MKFDEIVQFAATKINTYYFQVRNGRLWQCNGKKQRYWRTLKMLYVLSGSGSASVYDSGTLKDIKFFQSLLP